MKKAKTGNKNEKALTIREQKVVSNLMAGMNKKDALLSAGYAESTATKVPDEIIGKNRIQKAIKDRMEEMDLDDQTFLDTLKEGLQATKIISAIVIAPAGEGMKEAGGMTRDFIEVPDFDARHKYLTTGLKLKGHLRDKIETHTTVETYEERRRRLGLDRFSPKEVLKKFLLEHKEIIAKMYDKSNDRASVAGHCKGSV